MLSSIIMTKHTTTIITKAEDICEKSGARMTEPRRAVLEILSGSSKAMTAYDILDALRRYLDNPKPPTAYRAIEFWQEMGLIHRIESLNAYVLCAAGHAHHGSQFLICDGCGTVAEAHLCHMPDALTQKAAERNFTVSHWSVELHGQCAQCTARG